MQQPILLDLPASLPDFGGATYEPTKDKKRLVGQMLRVFDVMKFGRWLSLNEIQQTILLKYGKTDSEAGISARLRDLRKAPLHYTVERKRLKGQGTWIYRLVI